MGLIDFISRCYIIEEIFNEHETIQTITFIMESSFCWSAWRAAWRWAAPTEAPKPETEAPVEVTEPPSTEAPLGRKRLPQPRAQSAACRMSRRRLSDQISSTFIDPEFGVVVLNEAGRGSGFIIDHWLLLQ
jgi:hypothetical protein